MAFQSGCTHTVPPALVFEHVTEDLLHRRVPYGLAEKEELHAFGSDKPQRREEQEQFPKPEGERGHREFCHQHLSTGASRGRRGRGGGEGPGWVRGILGKAPFTGGVA